MHRPRNNTYDEVTYENVHDTRNDRRTKDKYNDKNMTYRDMPESNTNRDRYIDKHNDGDFRNNIVDIRDHDETIDMNEFTGMKFDRCDMWHMWHMTYDIGHNKTIP